MDKLTGLFIQQLYNGEKITFRAIQENGTGKENKVTHGEYNQKFIDYYNDKGCGIFILPNHTGSVSTKDADISRFNAVFIDIDDDKLPAYFPVEPSAIISRDDNQGHHVYWFLHPTEDGATWKTAQELLIQVYQSDAAIKNPARLMRLPGTVNQKPKRNGQTYQVRKLTSNVYDLNDIIIGHTDNKKIIKNLRKDEHPRIFKNLGADKGQRHAALIRLVTRMHALGFSEDGIFKELQYVNKHYFDSEYTEDTLKQKVGARQYARSKKGDERIEEIEKELARQETVREALADWYYIQTGNYFVHTGSLDIERTREGINAAFSNIADLGNVVHYAFLHNLIKQAERVIYEPGKEKICPGPAGLPLLNIWKDDAIKPDDTPEQWFIDHIKYLMSGVESEHFIDWLAYAVQNPGKKIMHAFLIIGGQGIGKSIMFYLFKQLFGPSNAKAPHNEGLSDKYTKWAKHCRFCLINELKQDGNHNFYNAIKPFITEDEIEIREMYRDPYTIRNTMNILAFSNDESPIRLEEYDRRWYVIKSTATRKPDAYYKKFIDMCDKNAGGVLRFLLARDLSVFNPGKVPENTEAKSFIIDQSKSDYELWLREQIESKNKMFEYDIISIADIMAELPLQFRTRFVTSKGTAKLLRKYGAVKIDQSMKINGDMRKFWVIRDKDKYIPDIDAGKILETVKKMYADSAEGPIIQ